jgi:DnaK suppressor protein
MTPQSITARQSNGGALPALPWSWHQNSLLQLRSRLEKDHDEQAAEAFETLEARSTSPAETATDEFDHEMSFALLANEEHLVQEVDAALARIAKGTYGLCEESGRTIPPARLRAIPWTRYTKEVAERLERQESCSQPHPEDE